MDGGNSERENTDMEPEMPGSPQNDKKRKSLATEDDPSLPDLEIEYGLDAAASISKKKVILFYINRCTFVTDVADLNKLSLRILVADNFK